MGKAFLSTIAITFPITVATALCSACTKTNQTVTNTNESGSTRNKIERVKEPDDPEQDYGIQKEEWPVRNQLIRGKPWGSENETEEQLLANLKEAESKPGPDLVDALDDLAGWYRGKKRYNDALNIYKREQDIQAKLSNNPNKLENAYPLNNIAVVCTEAKRFEEAERAFKACLAIHEKDTDPLNDDGEAETRHNYAEMLWGLLREQDGVKQNNLAYDLLRKRTEKIELSPQR